MEVYTVEQVAEKLSVGVYTIREWLRTGKLQGHKVGSLWRITSEDIDALLKNEQLNDDNINNANQISIKSDSKVDPTKETIKKTLLFQLAMLSEACEDVLQTEPELLPELTKEMVNVSTFLMEYCNN